MAKRSQREPVDAALLSDEEKRSMVRRNLRWTKEEDLKAQVWADVEDMSVNDFISQCVHDQIERLSGIRDDASLNTRLLQQQIDVSQVSLQEIRLVRSQLAQFTEAAMKVLHGDNYLLESSDVDMEE